jgi:hypothetical protein
MNARTVIRTPVVAVLLLLGAGTAQAAASVHSTSTAGPTAAAPNSVVAPLVTDTFRNQATGRCIDDSFQFGLRALICNGLGFQQWNVRVWPDNTQELKNVATGRCIDHSFDQGFRAFPCNGLGFQRWIVTPRPNGSIAFQNQATHRCMDDSFQFGLRAIPCNGSSFQGWF